MIVWLLRTILFVALLVFFIVVAVQNHDEQGVTLKLFTWDWSGVPLWAVMFGSILCGFLAGMLISVVREIRLRLDHGKLKRERDDLEREISHLRAAPLHDLEPPREQKIEPPL